MLKVIIIGDSGVGKTSLLIRYVHGTFEEETEKKVLDADYLTKEIQFRGKSTTLQMWDTAGAGQYQSLDVTFYGGADVCILVFDVTKPEKFESISQYKDEFLTQANPTDPNNFPFILLGNKMDELEDGKKKDIEDMMKIWCNDNGGMPYFLTSAKDDINVKEAFQIIPSYVASKKDKIEVFRLLLVGDAGVGKSSLILRYADRVFNHEYISTIGVDFKVRPISVYGRMYKLQIWDTAGQERFRTVTTSYYRGNHVFCMVFDVTNKESFGNISKELDYINTNAGKYLNWALVLVGNKCDLEERKVKKEDAQAYAASLGIPYIETSAKDGTNVDEAFATMAKSINAVKYQCLLDHL